MKGFYVGLVALTATMPRALSVLAFIAPLITSAVDFGNE